MNLLEVKTPAYHAGYEAGKEAKVKGVDGKNPHTVGTDDHKQWKFGYAKGYNAAVVKRDSAIVEDIDD